MKKILTLLVFVAITATSYGHALWLETPSQGKKGVAQKVKIFFGEFEAKEIDSTAKWFSNLKDFKIVLTAPDGSTQQLATIASTFYYEASFTPKLDGEYKLSVVHHVKDLYESAKIDYYALANVFVGKATANGTTGKEVALSIQPTKALFKTGQNTPYEVKLHQAAFKNQKITVVGPDKKSEKIETNAEGVFNFTPKQKGIHFLEAFYEEKKQGTQDGKSYDKIWHVVTYTNEII